MLSCGLGTWTKNSQTLGTGGSNVLYRQIRLDPRQLTNFNFHLFAPFLIHFYSLGQQTSWKTKSFQSIKVT